jgi:hypothetical protein
MMLPRKRATGAGPDLLAIDEALNRLSLVDSRKAKVVWFACQWHLCRIPC